MKTSARSLAFILSSLGAVPALASPTDGSCVDSSAPASFAAVSAAVNGAAALTSAPSPARFATAWTSELAAAVRGAAGTDGRLSRKEAERLAQRSIFGDNALNWLLAKDQQSVDVDKLIEGGWNYAFATGKKAAGADGRISLEDGKKLPEDLRGDYLFLRGKNEPGSGSSSELLAALGAAADGLWLTSESDAKVIPLESTTTGSGAITPEEVRAAFGAQHDALMRGVEVWGSTNPDYAALADRFPEVRSASEWLADYGSASDPGDPASVEAAGKWGAIGDALEAGLTNVTVIRFNEQPAPSEAITSSIFVVGRAADGRLVGVMSGAVET